MSKKSKKNIQQLVEKRRQLQLLQRQNAAGELPVDLQAPLASTGSALAAAPINPLPSQTPTSAATSMVGRELARTLVSVVMIAAVLIVFAVIDVRTDRVKQAGEWLYQTLRLAN